MDHTLIVTLTFTVLIILLLIEVPVAFSLAGSGTFGLIFLRAPSVAGATLASIPFQSISGFTLTVVPMFVLMGTLLMHGNIAQDLFFITNRLLRKVRGGVAIATIVTCAGFSAVCGSSVATAATVGRLTIGEMERYGFSQGFAAAVVACAGTLGVLIPPSIVLVLFGIITEESIGQLLIAGMLPGILSALILVSGVLVCARLGIGFTPAKKTIDEILAAEKDSPVRFGGVVKLLIIFLIVIGGIYSGIFTATEAAAVGALAAFLMMVLSSFEGDSAFFPKLTSALRDSASVTSMVFAIIVGASIFSFFIVSAGVPNDLARWMISFDLPPRLLVLLLLLSLIPLGMFLDGISILLITVPLFYPVVVSELGFNGIWYAVLTVKMIELGLITPPIGINVFIVAGLVDGPPVEEVFANITIFIFLDLIIFLILFSFPDIVTWLPARIY